MIYIMQEIIVICNYISSNDKYLPFTAVTYMLVFLSCAVDEREREGERERERERVRERKREREGRGRRLYKQLQIGLIYWSNLV